MSELSRFAFLSSLLHEHSLKIQSPLMLPLSEVDKREKGMFLLGILQ